MSNQRLYTDQDPNNIVLPSTDEMAYNFARNYPEETKHYGVVRSRFALNEEQRNEYLQIAFDQNPVHYLMIRTQLETGFRASEITNLIIDQLKFNSKFPMIRIESREGGKYHSAYEPKTNSGRREVVISQDLAQAIRMYVGKRKTGYVFISNKRTNFAVRSFREFVNQYAKKAKSIGFDIGTHTNRRTFASFQIKNGKDLGALSKDLGHKDIKTTMIYLFTITDMDEKIKTAEISEKMHDVKDKNLLKKRLEKVKARQSLDSINEEFD